MTEATDKAYIDFINNHYEAFTYSDGEKVVIDEMYDLIALEVKLARKGFEIVLVF